MKRFYILLLILLLTVSIFGQTDKSGVISSSETWSGTIYITGNVTIGDDVTITINSGTLVLFQNEGLYIEVNGTGSIDANGTSGTGNNILFSADHDEDGNYGESASNNNLGDFDERAGQLRFYSTSNSTGTSYLDYCNVEYIYNKNYAGTYGNGSVYTYSGTLAISNSHISNNESNYGGGIYLGSSSNITINNTIFEDNIAYTGGGVHFGGGVGIIKNCIFTGNAANKGGGISLAGGANPTLINCVIYSNSATSLGSGIYSYSAGSQTSIFNSTIAENSTTGSAKDVDFLERAGQLPRITNSIIWGSNIGTLSNSYITITNSAIQGLNNPEDHSSTISLSAINDDDDGPNFIDPVLSGGTDWSIAFISPCRDSGTDTGAPTTDYAGDNRIGTTDVGAYEVQYSKWTGSSGSTWTTSGNWEDGVTPSTGTGDVVIPGGLSNYPDESGSITIASGDTMIFEPGAQASFGTLVNNGGLKIESDNTDIASLKIGTYTDNGTAEIELFLEGGTSPDNMWHYVSSPVSDAEKGVFTNTTQNLLIYRESEALTDPYEGWAWHDGFGTSGVSGPAFGPALEVGRGYNVYHSADYTFSFSGSLNTSLSSWSLDFSDIGADTSGYNLLGNPFTCYLDWQAITDNTNFPENTSKAVYFTKSNNAASYNNGVVVNGATQYIPPMQGFFTKTYSGSNSIPIPSAALVHDNDPRYKGATIIPLIRLSISDNIVNDEMVIRFDNNADVGFDYSYDALKLFRSSSSLLVWTKVDNREYSINGTPFPTSNTEYNIEINIPATGDYTLSATDITGLDEYPNIYLIDTYQGNNAINIKNISDYAFSAEQGTFTDRFKISMMATSLDDIYNTDNKFNIYTNSSYLNVQTLSDEWSAEQSEISIYDITGRVVVKHNSIDLISGETVSLSFVEPHGIYLVEIKQGGRRVVQKVSHK